MRENELKLFNMLTDKSKKIKNVVINYGDNIEINFDNNECIRIVGFSDGIQIYYNDSNVPVYK